MHFLRERLIIMDKRSFRISSQESDTKTQLSNDHLERSEKRQRLAFEHTRFTPNGGQPLEKQARTAYEAEQQGKEKGSLVGEDRIDLLKDYDRNNPRLKEEMNSQEESHWSVYNDSIAKEIQSYQLEKGSQEIIDKQQKEELDRQKREYFEINKFQTWDFMEAAGKVVLHGDLQEIDENYRIQYVQDHQNYFNKSSSDIDENIKMFDTLKNWEANDQSILHQQFAHHALQNLYKRHDPPWK